MTRITCAQCGIVAEKPAGAVNRSKVICAPVYCGRECAGVARRNHKSTDVKRREKKLYDAAYRAARLATIKERKRAYHQRTYDPKKAAAVRKTRMPRHVEYCRRPEYREWKSDYDRNRRAREYYGHFADAYMTLLTLEHEINTRMTDYEIRTANGTLNKKLQRRRAWEQIVGSLTQGCALANPERNQIRQDARSPG